MNWQIWFIIILFVFIAVMMASQKFSLATVSLCCAVALEASGILNFKEAWGGLLQSSVVMMASMFVVGHALTKTSLLKRATHSLIKPGASDTTIAFGLFIMTFIITCFVNGITTVSIMAPIVVTVCQENKRPVSKFMQGVAVMSMVWAGVIPTGGNAGSYMGVNAYIEQMGGVGTMGYLTTMSVKLPIVLMMAFFVIFIMHRFAPDNGLEATVDAKQLAKAAAATRDTEYTPAYEKFVIGLFVVTIASIVYTSLTKGDNCVPPLIAAMILLLTGAMKPKEAIDHMGLPVIFLFVGMYPLSTALEKTGGTEIFANAITTLLGGTQNKYIVLFVFWLVSAALTQFMSNTTVTNIFKPLAIAVAITNGWNPVTLHLAVSIGSNCACMTPMASPCVAVGFNTGKYSMVQYFKHGLPLFIINGIMFMLWAPLILSL